MAASQAHGFHLEDAIRSNLYPGARKLAHIHPWDVEAGHSSWNALHPSQIKCATASDEAGAASDVMLGDALRNYDREGAFEMVIADLAQRGDEKVVRRYLRLAFEPGAFRAAIFGSMERVELEAADGLVKSVPIGDDPAARKSVHRHCQELEERAQMGGDLQAKMSRSKSQRRLQASCSQEALTRAASRAEAIGPERFAALGLPAIILSPRRTRRTRAQADEQAAAEASAAAAA